MAITFEEYHSEGFIVRMVPYTPPPPSLHFIQQIPSWPQEKKEEFIAQHIHPRGQEKNLFRAIEITALVLCLLNTQPNTVHQSIKTATTLFLKNFSPIKDWPLDCYPFIKEAKQALLAQVVERKSKAKADPILKSGKLTEI